MPTSKMDDYSEYLLENVLTDEKTITYRFLSRSLKVHVNTAKQMLYEFHRAQNAKRPGTVHATYLIYGVQKGSQVQYGPDGDIEMTSSPPYAESITDVVQSFSLSLVREEDLKDSLADFEEVISIHVYSVSPTPTKDIGLLVDAANEVLNISTEDDKKLVPINNPYVRIRERRGPDLKTAAVAKAPAAKQQPKTPAFKAAPAAAPAKVNEEPKPEPPMAEKPESTAKKPAPALKRNASSGIMAAFSKAAAKPKKEVKQEPKKEEPPVQALSDDGEDDEEEVFESKPKSSSTSKTKKQREEELRRMMEDDEDEEMEEKSEKAESPEPEPMEEEPPAPEPVTEEKSEIVESTANGRKRGKRKVMRKKQVMDDQGYLVTIQEPGWESFSEDEAPRPATKPKIAAAPAPAAKGKKGGAQKGQGSIMSFFSKKT
ncbi:DNA polymerase subunit Cdc27 [Cladorrhinum sp. PSN259]|nr:DNA polymerase subunit Cdc27 [Cladorrhinum sp. PSN259]